MDFTLCDISFGRGIVSMLILVQSISLSMLLKSNMCNLVNIFKLKNYMAVKNLHQFFYYQSKYLNSMKCREISMGPSIGEIQCSSSRSSGNKSSPIDSNLQDSCTDKLQRLEYDDIYRPPDLHHRVPGKKYGK
jgi:hypothetical protein